MQISPSTAVRITAFALLTIAANHATAQDRRAGPPEQGGYIGVEIGQFGYDEDLHAYFSESWLDDSSSSMSLYGGYRVGRWGVEFAYRDVNTLEDAMTFPQDMGPVTITLGTDVEALEIRFLGYAPLGHGSIVFGGGYADWDLTLFVRREGDDVPMGPIERSDSDGGAMGMLGYQLELERLDVRFAYELWDIEFGDADQLSVGVAFRF